jgi:hypothetical protein
MGKKLTSTVITGKRKRKRNKSLVDKLNLKGDLDEKKESKH